MDLIISSLIESSGSQPLQLMLAMVPRHWLPMSLTILISQFEPNSQAKTLIINKKKQT